MSVTKLNTLNGNLAVRVFALCAKSSNAVGYRFDWLFVPVSFVFVHRLIIGNNLLISLTPCECN